jgi:hypothetical protein
MDSAMAMMFFIFLAIVIGFLALLWAIWKVQTRHKHDWKEQGRRFVPGLVDKGGEVWGRMADRDDVIYGYTEVTYKCVCGHYLNRRVIGKING